MTFTTNGFNINRYKTFDELYLDASLERVGNDLLSVRKFGEATDIDANETEDLWISGGTKAIFTAAELINLVSSSVEDDPSKGDMSAGTGAYVVQIQGLDGDLK